MLIHELEWAESLVGKESTDRIHNSETVRLRQDTHASGGTEIYGKLQLCERCVRDNCLRDSQERERQDCEHIFSDDKM